MKSGIYCITNIIDNKRYVGSTAQTFHKRWWQHKNNLNKGNHNNPHLQNAWNKYGEESFSFEILEYCERENLIEREDWWIDLLGTIDRERGYNTKKASGIDMSDETKERISIGGMGRIPWNKGRVGVYSNETLNKMSNAKIGALLSEEHKAKIGAAFRGKKRPPFSEEHKAKISASCKGRSAWNKGITMSISPNQGGI